MDKRCQYTTHRKADSKTIIINCRNCTIGNSTFSDKNCRYNILKLLQQEHGTNQIILNHAFVKVFSNNDLKLIQQLSKFITSLESYEHVAYPQKNLQNCPKCIEKRRTMIHSLYELAQSDPVLAYMKLFELHLQPSQTAPECSHCEDEFKKIIQEIIKKADFSTILTNLSVKSDAFYTTYIRPYVRPGFIDSYIQLEPPADAVFLESYEVRRHEGRPINVTLYLLRSRPEKLYFVVPSEYDLQREELLMLERVREHLSRHRPKDASFMDAESAREYFQHFGRQVISQFAKTSPLNLTAERIDYLADIFARYTAGFGILEDLLSDVRIQDIYVNAPVSNNALHIVVDGEEYTSNIFLSDADIDALASRFRTLSGRAFSEAAPVLDMDLSKYHTRVAAISNPLTPKGIAFALRRHRQKPWTLAHFIANHMISPETAGLLSFLVDGQASLLVAGSRGSGKTSLLGAMMLEIPQRFRILTIEDTAEIPVEQLQQCGYKIQSLITRSISSGSASSEVDPTDALRTALRLGESVLILGEVRGVEAKVLFEAMRVGAAGNLIMGTIHGSTTRDVYERVVYDIGVPATSFKAVDGVIIAAPIRAEGGIERKRRVIQISEIQKTGWTTNPDPDKVFRDLMVYNTATDRLGATDILDMGQSELLGGIAKKWGISVEKALQNIKLRTDIKKTLVDTAVSRNRLDLLEAASVRDANNAFWMFIEEGKQKNSSVDYAEVHKKWNTWFQRYIG
ncbi:MAG: type II/IV secretion system ATPase subunit [Candidatus Thermoplasmatota archaeon]